MKSILSYSLLAAAMAAGVATAQTTATTKPVGYVSTTLTQGFNAVGLTLTNSSTAAGGFEAVTANSVSDNDINFGNLLVSGATYILEITSGPSIGSVHEVASWNANTLNTVDNLAARGVVANTTYKLSKAPTLEEIFGTTTSILKKGNSAAVADVVYVPTGPGTYNRYFLNNSSAWRNAAGGAATNIPLIYLDAIFIQKQDAGDVSFVVSGEVKTSVTVTAISSGFNLIGTLFPVGATLQNFGFESSIKKGNSAAVADIVWVPNPATSGGYDRYFLNNSNAWRNASGGAAPADVPLKSAVFIQRVDAGSAEFRFTPPSSYSSL